MYRTNHFNSSNFPICDLSNAQTYVCNVGAGTDTDFGFVLFQFAEQKFTESFVICIRNVQMCEAVDEMDFLRCPENDFFGFIKRHKQKLSCGKQDRDRDHTEQAVDR